MNSVIPYGVTVNIHASQAWAPSSILGTGSCSFWDESSGYVSLCAEYQPFTFIHPLAIGTGMIVTSMLMVC